MTTTTATRTAPREPTHEAPRHGAGCDCGTCFPLVSTCPAGCKCLMCEVDALAGECALAE